MREYPPDFRIISAKKACGTASGAGTCQDLQTRSPKYWNPCVFVCVCVTEKVSDRKKERHKKQNCGNKKRERGKKSEGKENCGYAREGERLAETYMWKGKCVCLCMFWHVPLTTFRSTGFFCRYIVPLWQIYCGNISNTWLTHNPICR